MEEEKQRSIYLLIHLYRLSVINEKEMRTDGVSSWQGSFNESELSEGLSAGPAYSKRHGQLEHCSVIISLARRVKPTLPALNTPRTPFTMQKSIASNVNTKE